MWCEITLGLLCAAVLVMLVKCYYMETKPAPAPEKFTAADVLDSARAAGQVFSGTLQRRMGMESAAGETFKSNSTIGTFDSYRQNFTSGDVGYGTMMAGYQRPTVLAFGRA